MRETIELGSVPYNEDCAQVGTDDYAVRAKQECNAFIAQLKRQYQQHFNRDLPEACHLRIRTNYHDFGSYYEVAVSFPIDSEAAAEAAFWLDENCPGNWDEAAKKELPPIF